MSSPPPPHNFRANWVSSALTVLLFLSFAFAVSGHNWSDTGFPEYSEYATNEYLFNGRNFGEAVPPSEYWTSSRVREENDKCLYGLVYVGGSGAHGAREETPWYDLNSRRGYYYKYRERVSAVTSASLSVWFDDMTTKGERCDRDVDLKYEIVAEAGRTERKADKDTVHMLREKVRYWRELDRAWRWRWVSSEGKSLSKTVTAARWVYNSHPYWPFSYSHSGNGSATVSGLTAGIASSPDSAYVEANYTSPPP